MPKARELEKTDLHNKKSTMVGSMLKIRESGKSDLVRKNPLWREAQDRMCSRHVSWEHQLT